MLLFGSVKTKIKDVMNQLAMHQECKYTCICCSTDKEWKCAKICAIVLKIENTCTMHN